MVGITGGNVHYASVFGCLMVCLSSVQAQSDTVEAWPCEKDPIQGLACGSGQNIACPLGGDGFAFYSLNIVNGQYESFPKEDPIQFSDRYNACGVNPVDGFAYCVSTHIVRLDATGKVTYVASVPFASANGDFSDDGVFYFWARNTFDDSMGLYILENLNSYTGFTDAVNAFDHTNLQPIPWANPNSKRIIAFDTVILNDTSGGKYGLMMSNTPVSDWDGEFSTDSRMTMVGYSLITNSSGIFYVTDYYKVNGAADSKYGAAWNYDGRIFFGANTGGVFELLLDTLNETTREVTLNLVGPSAITNSNDGMNCRFAKLPFPVCSDMDFAGNPFNCASYGHIYDSSLANVICSEYDVNGCTAPSLDTCCRTSAPTTSIAPPPTTPLEPDNKITPSSTLSPTCTPAGSGSKHGQKSPKCASSGFGNTVSGRSGTNVGSTALSKREGLTPGRGRNIGSNSSDKLEQGSKNGPQGYRFNNSNTHGSKKGTGSSTSDTQRSKKGTGSSTSDTQRSKKGTASSSTSSKSKSKKVGSKSEVSANLKSADATKVQVAYFATFSGLCVFVVAAVATYGYKRSRKYRFYSTSAEGVTEFTPILA